MNCAECRDKLVVCAEELLDREELLECRAHLENCAECSVEYRAITGLQQKLVTRGRASAKVAIVSSVMRRVLQEQTQKETIMSRIVRYRWGFGLSAAAAAAAIALFIVMTSPNAHAKAVEVLAKGAQAVARLTSIHLRGQLRTFPQDNFASINPGTPFCTIELWKQFQPELKWRIEKPGRVIVMDGNSTVMLIKPGSTAVKVPQRTTSAFDTDWLHRIANLSNTITNELKNALAQGWKLSLAEETGADGRLKSIVTVMAKSGVPDDDYTKNTFIENADTRRVYRFDSQSELLEAVQVYLVRQSGEEQIFELSQIDYNQSIEPSVWNLELPADVSWAQLPEALPKLPDNEKYASITPEQAARAFFEACSREDWEEVGKFQSPVNDRLKQYLGGLQLISLGEPFSSKAYPGRFVPYEIKLRPHDFYLRVSNKNAAGRYVITGACDEHLKLVQDLTWTNGPEVLSNNDAYARLSPAEAVKAYFEATSRLDWEEMTKFAPDYDVANDKTQVEAARKMIEDARKQTMDVRELLPNREALEATWSAEQSTWFVKCRESQIKKWNLAVRKDNPAGRWQVDGGI